MVCRDPWSVRAHPGSEGKLSYFGGSGITYLGIHTTSHSRPLYGTNRRKLRARGRLFLEATHATAGAACSLPHC